MLAPPPDRCATKSRSVPGRKFNKAYEWIRMDLVAEEEPISWKNVVQSPIAKWNELLSSIPV